jgi:glucose-6-phosphate isomerase
MMAEAIGMKLFFATERVNEDVMTELFALAEETQAIKKMHAMQMGEVVNFIEGYPSEDRPALHTAMRDFFDHRNFSGLDRALPGRRNGVGHMGSAFG